MDFKDPSRIVIFDLIRLIVRKLTEAIFFQNNGIYSKIITDHKYIEKLSRRHTSKQRSKKAMAKNRATRRSTANTSRLKKED